MNYLSSEYIKHAIKSGNLDLLRVLAESAFPFLPEVEQNECRVVFQAAGMYSDNQELVNYCTQRFTEYDTENALQTIHNYCLSEQRNNLSHERLNHAVENLGENALKAIAYLIESNPDEVDWNLVGELIVKIYDKYRPLGLLKFNLLAGEKYLSQANLLPAQADNRVLRLSHLEQECGITYFSEYANNFYFGAENDRFPRLVLEDIPVLRGSEISNSALLIAFERANLRVPVPLLVSKDIQLRAYSQIIPNKYNPKERLSFRNEIYNSQEKYLLSPELLYGFEIPEGYKIAFVYPSMLTNYQLDDAEIPGHLTKVVDFYGHRNNRRMDESIRIDLKVIDLAGFYLASERFRKAFDAYVGDPEEYFLGIAASYLHGLSFGGAVEAIRILKKHFDFDPILEATTSSIENLEKLEATGVKLSNFRLNVSNPSLANLAFYRKVIESQMGIDLPQYTGEVEKDLHTASLKKTDSRGKAMLYKYDFTILFDAAKKPAHFDVLSELFPERLKELLPMISHSKKKLMLGSDIEL